MGSAVTNDTMPSSTELTAPAIQHHRLRRAASTAYAAPNTVADTSRVLIVAGVNVSSLPSASTERPQDLHDEYRLAVALERGTKLAREGFHDLLVAAKDLGAHVVGDDLEAAIGIQAVDEAADRRDEVVPQWIEADLDADVHPWTFILQPIYLIVYVNVTPTCLGSPACT